MKRFFFLGTIAVFAALLFGVPGFAYAETPAMTTLETSFRGGLAAPYDLNFSDTPYAQYNNWFPGITFTTLRSRTAQLFSLNAPSVQRGVVFGSDAHDLGFPLALGSHGENTLQNYRRFVLAGDSGAGAITTTLTVGFVRSGSAGAAPAFVSTKKAGFRIVTTGSFTISLFDDVGNRVGSVDGNGTGFFGLTTWQPFSFSVIEFRNPISSGLAGLLYSSQTPGGSIGLTPPTPPVTYPVATEPGIVLGAETRAPAFIVAPGAGSAPEVRLLSSNGAVITTFFAYGEGYRGGVQVAMGDVDGDGISEIVTAPGRRSSTHVRIFRLDGTYLGGFFAYGNGFRGGVNLAVGDVDGDGTAEIVTAPKRGGGPRVRVVHWKGQRAYDVVSPFLAYTAKFRGGVRVALGDLDGDGRPELVTAPETGGSAQIRIFTVNGGRMRPSLRSFDAYSEGFHGGMTLAVGDFYGDGSNEIVTGRGDMAAALPRMFRYAPTTRTMERRVLSFADGTTSFPAGGAQLATIDYDGNGRAELVLAAGKAQEPLIEVFAVQEGEWIATGTFRAYHDVLAGGMNVAGGFLE